MKVSVDGEVVFALAPDERRSIELPVGAHVVVAKMDWVKSQPLAVDLDSDALCEVSMPHKYEHWYDILNPVATFRNVGIVAEIK
jgi:hypothetical protein